MTDTLVRPTRRTLVRSAAWSVPVVSLAATAPAFAASKKASIGAVVGSADKWGPDALGKFHVSWDLSLTNDSAEIDSISIIFTYNPNGGGTFQTVECHSYLIGTTKTNGTWGSVVNPVTTPGVYTVTSTRLENIAPFVTSGIHVDFSGDDNSSGTVSALVTINYVGGPSETVSGGSASWKPVNQPHTHTYTT